MHTSPESAVNHLSAPASFWQAFLFWLKLGFVSFGGPAGQIALMHDELVEKRRWISERRFLHALNFCMLLPGPEAQQLATYMGWLMHKTWGGIVAGVLFVLPSLLMLIGLAWVYLTLGDQPVVAGIFYGIKPAVTAIVVQACYRIGGRTLKNRWLWGIAVASFVAIFALHLPFPLIVMVAACAGLIGGRVAPQAFAMSGQAKTKGSQGGAWIDDDSLRPAHTHFGWARLLGVVAVGVLLWLAPMLWLIFTLGWAQDYTQMAWFFTKAAWLTFGGAYAVLPYVVDGAVTHYGWLTPAQMMDGLALGESTPGPLIMIVAFVAFVGGYGQALLGPEALFLAGAAAAVLVTWFTFLPSFVLILAGGPVVESTRNTLVFTAPLTAITAAVVGVIVNLALFFAYHVFWPQGFTGPADVGSVDFSSVILAVCAALALLRFKRSLLEVLAASALAGLAISIAAQ